MCVHGKRRTHSQSMCFSLSRDLFYLLFSLNIPLVPLSRQLRQPPPPTPPDDTVDIDTEPLFLWLRIDC